MFLSHFLTGSKLKTRHDKEQTGTSHDSHPKIVIFASKIQFFLLEKKFQIFFGYPLLITKMSEYQNFQSSNESRDRNFQKFSNFQPKGIKYL